MKIMKLKCDKSIHEKPTVKLIVAKRQMEGILMFGADSTNYYIYLLLT